MEDRRPGEPPTKTTEPSPMKVRSSILWPGTTWLSIISPITAYLMKNSVPEREVHITFHA